MYVTCLQAPWFRISVVLYRHFFFFFSFKMEFRFTESLNFISPLPCFFYVSEIRIFIVFCKGWCNFVWNYEMNIERGLMSRLILVYVNKNSLLTNTKDRHCFITYSVVRQVNMSLNYHKSLSLKKIYS